MSELKYRKRCVVDLVRLLDSVGIHVKAGVNEQVSSFNAS